MMRVIKRKVCVSVATLLLALAPLTNGRTIHVDDDANGLNDGSSWVDAYKFLQDALEDANSSAKTVEIRVAQGIYRPDQTSAEPNGTGDREATFQLINSVTIKGGYAGFSQPDPNERDVRKYETILSGHLNGTDSYRAVTGIGNDANAVLDGFTISGGMYNEHANPTVTNCIFNTGSSGYGGCVFNYYSNPRFANCVFSGGRANAGGGMCNQYSSPTLNNCTFSENKAWGGMMGLGGGGMYNEHSSPTLTNCTFSKNQTDNRGGGMYNLHSSATLVYCTFTENSGSSGGGICNRWSNAKLTDCIFSKNMTGGYGSGGGICNEYESSLTLINCIFNENSARDGGGVYSLSSSATLINCSFVGNSAHSTGNEYGYGGGMFNRDGMPILTDCTFSGNLAERSGGGIYTGWDLTIINCIFNENSAADYGGGMDIVGNPTLTNCMFSGNSAGKMGGGLNIWIGTSILSNCTFTGNLAKNGKALACNATFPGYGNVKGVNCILWDGWDEIFKIPLSKVDITFSDIQGGWPGEGNIDKDPCFADPGHWDPNGTPQDPNDDFWVNGDYHLKSQAGRWDPNSASWVKDELTSLCIDAGDPASPIGLEPFPNGGRINMGSFGGTEEASKSYFGEPACETIVAGDINGDCKINLKDFAIMSLHWFECKAFCPPDQASNPNPADGTTNVNINVVLSWTPGYGATSHDVYFGTDNPPPFIIEQNNTTFVPSLLSPGTTYYWRINERNTFDKTTGPIWRFSTMSIPGQSCNPSPPDGAAGIALNTQLSWTAGSDTESHDIYFGTTNPPPFRRTQSNITFKPSILASDTTYFWRINELNSSGTTVGELWSFTTTTGTTSIVAWGGNIDGQCNIPSPNTGFVAIAAGTYHSLAIKSDGFIVGWGWNGYGQCNIPSPNNGFIAIAGGTYHSIGLKQDGSLVAWGSNDQGQCNIPSLNTGFIAIAAGEFHSLGLKQDGSIVAWGANNRGQCNIPSPNNGFVAIAASGWHSLGLKQDGSIAAFGRNDFGQCNIPSPNTGFIAIAAGTYHSLGLKADGSIVAWGNNDNGQCNIPSPNTGFIDIAAGWSHSLGLKADGYIVAWGNNTDGQCTVPSPNTGFAAIAAGSVHSLAIKIDH
jgi:predicted outer membrane repeat protein